MKIMPKGPRRSGKLYASVTVALEAETWQRVDALAEKHGKTRHAMARIVMEKGIEAMEAS